MCLTVPHTNPDGTAVEFPHYHTYREGFDDKFADSVGVFGSMSEALDDFCGRINLPAPKIQGGLR
jgi:hypothetical protein